MAKSSLSGKKVGNAVALRSVLDSVSGRNMRLGDTFFQLVVVVTAVAVTSGLAMISGAVENLGETVVLVAIGSVLLSGAVLALYRAMKVGKRERGEGRGD